jgi:hypothetical protein
MGHNSMTREQGLKDWAKFRSKMALKHGCNKFTQSTSSGVSKSLLVCRALNQASRTQVFSSISMIPPPTRRKTAHFQLERDAPQSSATWLLSLDQHGKANMRNQHIGCIQPRVQKAIDQLERDQGNQQEFFEIWCEARLASGQFIRCWPQYHSGEGSRYDWVMVAFDTSEGQKQYPTKVIALYEDSTDGTFKALIHSVDWKLNTNPEGPCGDSQLVTHHCLQFAIEDTQTLCWSHSKALCAALLDTRLLYIVSHSF